MSTNGIKTSFWGPPAWKFLFSMVAGTFPVKVDSTNKAHSKIVSSFHSMFKSLENTLPCIYCRESYKIFLKELPMSEFSDSRKNMMKWLYLIRDRVNQKLMKQERECYESERAALMKKNINPDKLKTMLKTIRQTTLITKPSPSFEKVLTSYEKQRAGCSKKTKKCT